MIPGDIDLTEKLDFRKTVKKETPQLPSLWNKNNNKLNTSYINGNTITITSGNNSTYTYRTNISIDTDTHINRWFDDIELTVSTYDSFDTIMTYSTSISAISTTTNSRYITTNKIYPVKEEYDVFGNKKNLLTESIPKIPWSTFSMLNSIRPIPWNNGRDVHLYRYDYNENIPWEFDDDDDYIPLIRTENDRIDRCKQLISWLSDKSRSFIRGYFDSNNDEANLSYLTNMSWIRVKDAIID